MCGCPWVLGHFVSQSKLCRDSSAVIPRRTGIKGSFKKYTAKPQWIPVEGKNAARKPHSLPSWICFFFCPIQQNPKEEVLWLALLSSSTCTIQAGDWTFFEIKCPGAQEVKGRKDFHFSEGSQKQLYTCSHQWDLIRSSVSRVCLAERGGIVPLYSAEIWTG